MTLKDHVFASMFIAFISLGASAAISADSIRLNETLFSSLPEARETLEEWQEDYNNHRPHSALGNLTPREFAEKTNMDKLAA